MSACSEVRSSPEPRTQSFYEWFGDARAFREPEKGPFRRLKVELGPKAREKTWQAEFPEKVKCVHCGKPNAPLAFVAYEGLDGENPKKTVSQIYKTEPDKKGKLWLHDACAVAVYFCRHCLKPTAEYNQG